MEGIQWIWQLFNACASVTKELTNGIDAGAGSNTSLNIAALSAISLLSQKASLLPCIFPQRFSL